jgi:tetratricopeptide (TPR) repeat protein
LSKFIQRFGAILLIIGATFVVYAPALRNGFVWDDTALALRDPLIRSWRLIPEGFRHFLFVDATGSNFYRPLQRLTFTADYALWGFEHPGGWHFTSVALHAAAAVALYAFLRRWLGEERRHWWLGAALLWAIHPLHTSAVTYVAGRADLLAALCGFIGLWFALGEGKRSQFYAALCLLGALLSKESGGMFLVVWLLFLGWRRVHRSTWTQAASALVVVLAVYLPLRFTAHKTPPPPSQPTPLSARPILATRAVAEYAGLFLAPVNLRMERDVATRPTETPAASHAMALRREAQTLLGALLIVGLIAWFRRADSDTRLALLAATVVYLPISNITPLNATVAEHWLYVPSAFLLAACSRGALGRVGGTAQRAVVTGVAIWALLLAVRTWVRQADWRDQRTFLTRTIAAGGDSARMHVNLGNLEAGEVHPDRAMAEYEVALQREPDLSFAHFAVASVQLKLGKFAETRAALDRAEKAPGLEAEKLTLRTALDFAEKKIDPVPGYRAAADLEPLNWPLRQRYLGALAVTGRQPEAVKELRTFLTTQDFRAEPWLLLAKLVPDLAEAARAEARRRDARLP